LKKIYFIEINIVFQMLTLDIWGRRKNSSTASSMLI